MNEITITLDQLRGMIGITVQHRGEACEVFEVLEDGPSLVLRCTDHNNIQPNQHGNPARRTPHTYTIRVLSSDRKSIHPDFLALDLV